MTCPERGRCTQTRFQLSPAAGRWRWISGAPVRAQLSFEDTDDFLVRVGRADDYLDALICALVARAAELGSTYEP